MKAIKNKTMNSLMKMLKWLDNKYLLIRRSLRKKCKMKIKQGSINLRILDKHIFK